MKKEEFPIPVESQEEVTVKRIVFSGSKNNAILYKNTNNKIFSNKYRDTEISGGDIKFIVKKSGIIKGDYVVIEVRKEFKNREEISSGREN